MNLPVAGRTRVVVIDNSATVRSLLVAGLRERGLEVVAEGADGHDAVELCRLHRPDALSLDLMMPRMSGLEALDELRRQRIPVPTVIVSGVAADGSERAVRLLEAGAVEVLAKPVPGTPLAAFLDLYAETLRVAAEADVERIWREDAQSHAAHPPEDEPRPNEPRRLVILAASTGGPRGLNRIVSELPASLGCGSLVVQHMPPTFTRQLAARLDRVGRLRASEARPGDAIAPDRLLVAPADCHLRVTSRFRVGTSTEPVGTIMPRADVTITDAVEQFESRVLLVVLSGMGTDGLQGARQVKANGGVVIAESPETALINGMPGAIARAGLADAVLPLPEIASAICRHAG